MASHSSILAWRILWTRGTWRVHRVAQSGTQMKQLSMHALSNTRTTFTITHSPAKHQSLRHREAGYCGE